jgi:fermentation-respiration switch protein FrsA (DUF1100 family)
MTTEEGSYISKLTGRPVLYLRHLPKDFDKTKKYPVIVSLTGDGEKEPKGLRVLRNSGINNHIANKGMEIPFIVFSPMTGWQYYDNIGPNNDFRPGEFVAEAADVVIGLGGVDEKRIAVCGLSMGGISVYYALSKFPNKFCSGVCMASWPPDAKYAKDIKGAIWDIQSEGDPISHNPDYAAYFLGQTQSKEPRLSVMASAPAHYIWEPVYSNSWTTMQLASRYSHLDMDRPENIYNWLLKFSLDGVVPEEPPMDPEEPEEPEIPNPPTTNLNSEMTIKDASGNILLGKIEAENYNYTNKSGNFLETSSEGTKNIGWVRQGDILSYSVNIPVDGLYSIELRVASVKNTEIKVEARNSVVVIPISNTSSWQTWKSFKGSLNLTAGVQIINIVASQDGWNLNWLNISLQSISINGFTITE